MSKGQVFGRVVNDLPIALLEAVVAELAEFTIAEGPGGTVGLGVVGSPVGGEAEFAVGGDEAGDRGDGLGANVEGEGLKGAVFPDEVEGVVPMVGEVEEVGGGVGDGGIGEALLAPGDRGGGDVEGGDAVTGGGNGLGVVAEAATDDDCGLGRWGWGEGL